MTSCNKNDSSQSNYKEEVKVDLTSLNYIKALPKGFEVSHSPEVVKASATGNPIRPFRWEHKTSVTPIIDGLKITGFAYFVLIRGDYVYHSYASDSYPYDSNDFSIFFDSDESTLTKGKVYTRVDWTENESLMKSTMIVYFVGEDSEGKHYSGYSTVTKAPEEK